MRKRIQSLLTCLFFALLLLPALQASAQSSVTFKPAGVVGEDVYVSTSYGCTPSHLSQPAENINWEPCGDLQYAEWTINQLNCTRSTDKTLIRFTEMNTVPLTAIINYAELRLWTPSTSGCVPQGNSYFTGSPHPTNEGFVSRVTSGWTETGVTWNTQPSITTVNQSPISATHNQWNDYIAINVTALTKDILASMAINPANNNGYMLQMLVPNYYRSAVFASSENPNALIRPELYIEFGCEANFNLCNTSRYPNTFDFTAFVNDPSYRYDWDFGDGNTGTGYNTRYTYKSPGNYTVCLTVTMPGGLSCTKCIEICVHDIMPPPKEGDQPIRPCDAHFRSCNSTLYPNKYNFTPMYLDPGDTYKWDFGDGSVASGQNVTHVYTATGYYRVCLTVYKRDGRTCRECIDICVNEVIDSGDDSDGKSGMKESLHVPGAMNNSDGSLVINGISPNPAFNNLDVDLKLQKSGEVVWTVYSLDGKVLINETRSLSEGTQKVKISIDRLPAGMYILEMKDGESQARYKFVKE